MGDNTYWEEDVDRFMCTLYGITKQVYADSVWYLDLRHQPNLSLHKAFMPIGDRLIRDERGSHFSAMAHALQDYAITYRLSGVVTVIFLREIDLGNILEYVERELKHGK